MKPVLIIGAGIAGLTAAITLAEHGRESILIAPMPSERAQSVMAEGGINAALDTKGQQDTVEEHFRDTMAAGCDLADPNAVRALTQHAPETVMWLAGLGVAFNRTESGALDLRYFGGQKKQRTAFAQSSTGKQVTSALIQEVRRWENEGWITRRSHHRMTELIMENGCCGCILMDTRTSAWETLNGPVLLACGGLNGLFGKTTGTLQNTGAAAAAAFAAGAAMGNLEMIQYHPTTVALSGKRALISEAARGEGGRLYIPRGGQRWYYMEEKYPELKNLMPRDVVARETEQVCRENHISSAFLDLTGIAPAIFDRKLEGLRSFCLEFLHLDPEKEPIPVYPGIHYFMGGLYVDAAHRTTLPGLYAAGECACQYHGANRLGGNSLLGAAFGGRRAAQTLLDAPDVPDADPAAALRRWQDLLKVREERRNSVSCTALREDMVQVLKDCMGIRRCAQSLEDGAQQLRTLRMQLLHGRDSTAAAEEQLELERRSALALAMVESALARQESRGAHFRTDFPARDDARFRKTTVVRWEHDAPLITLCKIAGEGQR